MYKKSTTKISILLFLFFSCFVLFSCVDPSNDNTNEIDEKNNSKLYSAMIGTWVNEKDDSDKINFTEETLRKGVSIEELLSHASKEPITDEDYENNTTNYENLKWLLEICNEKSICFYEPSLSTPEFIITYAVYKLNIDNTILTVVSGWAEDGPVPPDTYIRPNKENTDTENNETSLSVSDITGSYTISEANGSTFTFTSDGNWTYKYNSRTTNGTWSVSEGKVTINYSLGGYSSTAVFTVKVSDNQYTLTGKSGDYTTIISSAFMITNQEAMEKGVVTLIKQ